MQILEGDLFIKMQKCYKKPLDYLSRAERAGNTIALLTDKGLPYFTICSFMIAFIRVARYL